jgi:hypothetical protein
MFGLTTFAQAPFDALGGNQYVFSISENINPADSSSTATNFKIVYAENLTVGNIDSEGALFFENISESDFSS